MRLIVCFSFALVLSAQVAPMQEGITAMSKGDDARAIDAFTRTVQADPQNVQAWMFLGGLYAKAHDASRAEDALQSALRAQPDNPQVIEALGTFYFSQRKLDPAAEQFERLTTLQADRKDTWLWVGRVALERAREDKSAATSHIDRGIRAIERALTLDAQYADALYQMHLLMQERDPEAAKQWLSKAIAARQPPPTPQLSRPAVPGQIRVGGNVQAAKLVRAPAPVYPAAAEQARLQGIVRLNVTIGKDGRVINATVVSGHPLFVPSALEAVRQYEYQTTLLNGQPVEVVTQVDVNFTLP